MVLVQTRNCKKCKSYKPDLRKNGHSATWLVHPSSVWQQSFQRVAKKHDSDKPQCGRHQNPTKVLVPWRLKFLYSVKVQRSHSPTVKMNKCCLIINSNHHLLQLIILSLSYCVYYLLNHCYSALSIVLQMASFPPQLRPSFVHNNLKT